MNMTRTSSPYSFSLALLLVTAACGGSGDTSDTSGTSSSASSSTGATATGDTGDTTTAPTGSTASADTSSTSPPTTGTTAEDTGASTTSPESTSTTAATSSTGTTSEDTDAGSSSSGTGSEVAMSFFVSSSGSATADLGGLAGADQRCQDLAEAVGAGAKTWHAYLSVELGPDDQPVHAKDRIGTGPWYNAELVMLASDLADLHTKDGDETVFLDETGAKINGQWADSPKPNEHDILTGSNKDGTLAVGKTCADWTSDDPALFAQVGHSDGLGPNMSDDEQYRSWSSVHESGGCNDTAPKGGAGHIYCFAID